MLANAFNGTFCWAESENLVKVLNYFSFTDSNSVIQLLLFTRPREAI